MQQGNIYDVQPVILLFTGFNVILNKRTYPHSRLIMPLMGFSLLSAQLNCGHGLCFFSSEYTKSLTICCLVLTLLFFLAGLQLCNLC